MSTRKATYVTLDELVAEVGADVTKFFMLMSGSSSHMTFDLNLARDSSDRNPVYKVQYAHARIGSIVEKAKITSPNTSSRGGEGEVGEGMGKEELGLIKELAKSKSKIIFKPLPQDDPNVRCPDITRAKKELKWEPKVGLNEGLMKTIEWFRSSG